MRFSAALFCLLLSSCAAGEILDRTSLDDGSSDDMVERAGTREAADTREAVKAPQACAVDQRTAEVAIEAFYAVNQRDATSMDELVPDYLLEAPERFEFVPGSDGSIPEIRPIPGGPCDLAP